MASVGRGTVPRPTREAHRAGRTGPRTRRSWRPVAQTVASDVGRGTVPCPTVATETWDAEPSPVPSGRPRRGTRNRPLSHGLRTAGFGKAITPGRLRLHLNFAPEGRIRVVPLGQNAVKGLVSSVLGRSAVPAQDSPALAAENTGKRIPNVLRSQCRDRATSVHVDPGRISEASGKRLPGGHQELGPPRARGTQGSEDGQRDTCSQGCRAAWSAREPTR